MHTVTMKRTTDTHDTERDGLPGSGRRRCAGRRETADPHTEWEGEEAHWNSIGWSTLHGALPLTEPIALTNRNATPHPRNSAITLIWPPNGVLTTPERRAWSGHAIGAGRRTGIISPRDVAAAFAASIRESDLGQPSHWDTCWTCCGDWWALRAAWSVRTKDMVDIEPVEMALTIRHDVCTSLVLMHGGWRQERTGAEIGSGVTAVRIGRQRLRMHRFSGGAAIHAMLRLLEQTADLMAAWSLEGIDRNSLASWAGAIAGPRFGRDMPARLIEAYDRRRDPTTRENNTRADSVRDLAWLLAERSGEVRDIDRRVLLQQNIADTVSELAWWRTRGDPDTAKALRWSGTTQIH